VKTVQQLQHELMRSPDNVVLLCQLALALEQSGEWVQAKAMHQLATLKSPGFLPAYLHAASLCVLLGQYDEATDIAQMGLLVDYQCAELHVVLGQTARHRSDPVRAEVHWQRASQMDPTNVDALQFLSALALERREYDRASTLADRLELVEGGVALSHLIRGAVCQAHEQVNASIQHFKHVLTLEPNHAVTWLQLGIVQFQVGQTEAAAEAFAAAALHDPEMSLAWYNQGRALEGLGRYPEAIDSFETALSLESDGLSALAGLIQCRRSLCDWTHLHANEQHFVGELARLLGTPQTESVPLLLLAMVSDDRELHLKLAKQLAAAAAQIHWPDETQQPAAPIRTKPARIKVGYLTYDCRDHPMAHLMVNVLESHRREQVEVTLYSIGPDDGSDYRRRMSAAPEHFVDAHGWTDTVLFQKIRSDGIHILVDLMGHTRGDRLSLLSRRPAPIQVSWLGYPGTTGARFIDYLLVDEVVVPPEHRAACSESLAYLPTYQPSDAQLSRPEPMSRQEAGLPQTGVVLACFCRPDKLDPVLFSVWMAILRQVPKAILWLYVSHPVAQKNLLNRCTAHDLDPTRIVFAGRLPKDQHLRRIGVADLMLDTRLYNGHTTTADALQAGVPVITLLGEHFPSRVSASLLRAQGLQCCITEDLQAYQQLIVDLASDPVTLSALRRTTCEALAAGTLFQSECFIQRLERLFQTMVAQQVKAGVHQDQIVI
jgi:protein O-GlcNAc transferase